MASSANALRLGLRTCSRQTQTSSLRIAAIQRRALSATATRCEGVPVPKRDNDVKLEFTRPYTPGEFLSEKLRSDDLEDSEREVYERALTSWNQTPDDLKRSWGTMIRDIEEAAQPLRRVVMPKKQTFWYEEEKDTDLITNEEGEDDFQENDIMSLGHGKLEEHREYREYARIAVWEMPLLSKYAKPFVPPTSEEVLRFRYTTYMGEFHPADRKVVVEFCPKDLRDLTEVQQRKLMKLAGPRYNPEKDIIKMSCEKFEHQAQNKRYIGDLIKKMIVAAKDPTDTFEDIPLDTRHHTFTKKIFFPKEWLLTQERKKELEAARQQALLKDAEKVVKGALVDGADVVKQYLESGAAEAMHAVPAMAGRGGKSLPGGKGGKMQRSKR
ncbi:mitochondrial ribosomal protein [Pseudoneurospora amorphoporcata]|uniref:Small ribosomal subunit protein mS35 n=1 Tax=Pseudoneurospora amorphoporcata TaxID=241081 RepID=A0AAN6SIN9_9PEZI|nr:mitochondrial ribosomal protein [Pseudoneurospora amorphoporcata]